MAKCAIINGACPKTSNPDAKRFCPAWDDYGIVWEKDDGQTLVYNCAFQTIAPALLNVMKAGNRAAASAESHRNAVVGEVQQLRHQMGALIAISDQRSEEG